MPRLYTAPVALSFAHILCSLPILQCALQALQLFTHFLSHRFHFEICHSTIKFCCTPTWLVQCSIFSFALFLYAIFFLCWFFSQWLPRSFILHGNNLLQSLGLPPLLISLITCLKLTMARLSRRQQPLRSSFAHTIRRNRLSGSTSSRRSSPWWASSRKNSGTSMFWPVCPSKSFGTF